MEAYVIESGHIAYTVVKPHLFLGKVFAALAHDLDFGQNPLDHFDMLPCVWIGQTLQARRLQMKMSALIEFNIGRLQVESQQLLVCYT